MTSDTKGPRALAGVANGAEGDAYDSAVDAVDRHGALRGAGGESGGLFGLDQVGLQVDVAKPRRVAREVKQLQGVRSRAGVDRAGVAVGEARGEIRGGGAVP